MIAIWSYQKLTISVQNVVHMHAHTLSVILSTCWWLHQWRSAADYQMLTSHCFSSLTQKNLFLFILSQKLQD